MKLLIGALTKFIMGILMVGALVFLPAWDIKFTNGWLFMGLLFIPMLIVGVVMLIKSPALLKKRLDAKETQNTQKGVVAFSGIIFIAGVVVAGLDHRFGWSRVPLWAVISASVVLLVSYALYAEVMRENAYLSRTIKVEENQQIVDTGLYGTVRHPMYAATIWLFLSIPVVRGSWWSLLCFSPYVGIIAVRIIGEEKLLDSELVGYAEYKKKVKYRLIPFIW